MARSALLMFVISLVAGCAGGVQYSDSVKPVDVRTTDGDAVTRVAANADEWRNSGVLVKRGSTYRITSTGRWTAGPVGAMGGLLGVCGWTGPDGVGISSPCHGARGHIIGGGAASLLVARIGDGPPFAVGAHLDLLADADGILYFRINDGPIATGDNEGSVVVRIAAAQATAQAPPARPTRGADTQPPVITVNYPPPNARVEHEEIVVTGVVVDDIEVASVETAVNGTPVRSKPAPGGRGVTLRVLVPLRPGENIVEITARDAAGNIAQSVRSVTRTVPATASALTPAPSPAPPAPAPAGAVGFGRYHALVIGNQRYRTLRALGTPVADATAVAETLQRDYGFTRVKTLLDASRTDILNAFDELRRTLQDDDNLLIYYAGHGWLDKDTDRGYWLPIDAADDTRANWLSNADITDTLKALRARHVVIVADSCYSGTLTRSITVQRDGGDIARLAQKRSRTALTSGGLEPVADGGGGGHSVFAQAFLSALRANRGTVDLTTLFTVIRRQVLLNAEQTPEYTDIRNAGHDGGDFVFARPR